MNWEHLGSTASKNTENKQKVHTTLKNPNFVSMDELEKIIS